LGRKSSDGGVPEKGAKFIEPLISASRLHVAGEGARWPKGSNLTRDGKRSNSGTVNNKTLREEIGHRGRAKHQGACAIYLKGHGDKVTRKNSLSERGKRSSGTNAGGSVSKGNPYACSTLRWYGEGRGGRK